MLDVWKEREIMPTVPFPASMYMLLFCVCEQSLCMYKLHVLRVCLWKQETCKVHISCICVGSVHNELTEVRAGVEGAFRVSTSRPCMHVWAFQIIAKLSFTVSPPHRVFPITFFTG